MAVANTRDREMANFNQLSENNHNHDHDPHLLNERFIVHANRPGHMGTLSGPDGYARGVGICGDAIEIFLLIQKNKIADIRHSPKGCTYTVACGSALCHLACGKTLEDALKILPEDIANELDGLPDDHMHCAALAVNTMGEAIDDFYQKIWGKKKPAAATLMPKDTSAPTAAPHS